MRKRAKMDSPQTGVPDLRIAKGGASPRFRRIYFYDLYMRRAPGRALRPGKKPMQRFHMGFVIARL
jgi:hypothetical protein